MNDVKKINQTDVLQQENCFKESRSKLNEFNSVQENNRNKKTSDVDPNERVDRKDEEMFALEPQEITLEKPSHQNSDHSSDSNSSNPKKHHHSSDQNSDSTAQKTKSFNNQNSEHASDQRKTPLAQYNYEDRQDQFGFELLRQIHKLQKTIPSKQVRIGFCRVKLIAYDSTSRYGLARSVPIPSAGRRQEYPENQLFHRNDFRNHPYLIDTIINTSIEFQAIVAKNGSTIPRILQLDYEFIKMLKKTFNYYVFKCSPILD